MTRGLGWSLRILGADWDLSEFYLMFLSREIDIKLCQNYTKTYIWKIYVHITWPELPLMVVQYTVHEIQTETRDNNCHICMKLRSQSLKPPFTFLKKWQPHGFPVFWRNFLFWTIVMKQGIDKRFTFRILVYIY